MKFRSSTRQRGFTLIEVLVSSTILVVLLLLMVTVLEQTQKGWRSAKSRVEQFRGARIGFEIITRNASQATLNTYWDYYWDDNWENQIPTNQPPATPKAPDAYVRQSELHFHCGKTTELLEVNNTQLYPGHALFFQAPLGFSIQYPTLNNLLNGRGYFVMYGPDRERPEIVEGKIPVRNRYRLYEYRPPSENNLIYNNPKLDDRHNWYKTGGTSGPTSAANVNSPYLRPVAENILAVFFSPRSSVASGGTQPWAIAPNYRYNSADIDNSTPTIERISIKDGKAQQGTQHLLPPLLQITMVAIDEPSAQRIENNSTFRDELNSILSTSFSTVSEYETDLEALETFLNKQTPAINYRVFNTTMPLRTSKWDGRIQ